MSRVGFASRISFWGGGEAILLGMAEACARRGHDVVLDVPTASALATRWGGARGSASAADVLVANDFRSLWTRVRPRRQRRFFIVHGWWQTSSARNVACAALDVRLLCVSSSVRDAVLGNGGGLTGDRVRVIPIAPAASFRPAAPDERQAAVERLHLPPTDLRPLYVGRPQPEKGLDRWLDIVRASGLRGLAVTPASPGSAAEERVLGLVQRADREGVVDWRPGADVRTAMWASDVLLSPSDFESLGLAMLEALATGLPVLTSAIGGPDDYLVPGVNGYRFSTADQATLILSSLAADEVLLAELASAAAATARAPGWGPVLDMMGL